MALTMTNEEILRHFSQAANKKADVKVIADLCATSEAEIWDILLSGGADPAQLPKRPAGRPKKPKTEDAAPAAPAEAVSEEPVLREKTVKRFPAGKRGPRKTPEAAAPPAPVRNGKASDLMLLSERSERIVSALPLKPSEEVRHLARQLLAQMAADAIKQSIGEAEE